MPPPRKREAQGPMTAAEATRGHQISTYIPGAANGYKSYRHSCSCGWRYERQRVDVRDPNSRQVRRAPESMDAFRSAATAHLYEIWRGSRQGTLV